MIYYQGGDFVEMKKRIIFHIDVNSAFLSWEAIYRIKELKETLDLRTIPSAVGGDIAKRRGIILAKSIPAKQFNINTGEPVAQALKKCPNLTLVPPRFDYFVKCSNSMMKIFQDYTPDIEKFSIDEAFLDMTETIHLFGSPVDIADQIRERIYNELGFTVNIGISTNKLLAKMASDFRKPNLCHTLFPEEIAEKMWPLPIRELYFVGKMAAQKCQQLGIQTIGDIANCDLAVLQSHLGQKYGKLIHDYANGIDSSPVGETDSPNKGYGNSITLSKDISDYDSANQVLLSLSETVGSRLRDAKVKCNCITVEIRDYNFNQKSHQITLDTPTDITSVIYETSCRLLKEIWDNTPLRLMGIRTTKITDDDFTQLSIFNSEKNEKLEKLDVAVDKIRDRYGTDSIKRASFLTPESICEHSVNRHKTQKP